MATEKTFSIIKTTIQHIFAKECGIRIIPDLKELINLRDLALEESKKREKVKGEYLVLGCFGLILILIFLIWVILRTFGG